ncbi:MAG: dTTP/UTP pyrophosphatase [Chlamydiia bacterium]|nr:dTTP/UTP pyrophosphatase [Chlamydiia bacterium]
MKKYHVPFSQIAPQFDEKTISTKMPPAEYCQKLAECKAQEVASNYSDHVVIAGDTIVALGDQIFNKPTSIDEGKQMLKNFSGKTHGVYSALSVQRGKELFCEVDITYVTFFPLTDEQIDAYYQLFLPTDCSGGYSIERGGELLIEKLEGTYDNVAGFPMKLLIRGLAKHGIDIWDFSKAFLSHS